MTIRKYQARTALELEQPGVSRRVERIVERGDREHLVPGTRVTMDELHEYQLLGRRLQARAAAAAFGSLGRALAWPFRKLAAAGRRLDRESLAIRQLSALDDHLLRDIGITRERIPSAVAGLLARSQAVAAVSAAPRELPRRPRPTPGDEPPARKAA